MRARNFVISAIAVAWGSAILIYALLGGETHGSAAYHTGQVVGLVFAVALLLAGGRGLRREIHKRR
jgi:hypothetical protein